MNPVSWEIGPTAEGGGIRRGSGTFYYTWDYYYNNNSRTTGVGAFAITSSLGTYLQTVSQEAPELLDYFRKTTEYSYNWGYHPNLSSNDFPTYGDMLLQKIGDEEFNKLVDFEVKYAIEKFNPSRTQSYMSENFSNPKEAAHWWMVKWEIPRYSATSDNNRQKAAEKAYEELRDYTCSSGYSESSDSNSSSSSASSEASVASLNAADITLIGDSISVQSESELEQKFPTGFFNKVGSRHPTSGGICGGDEGGFSILQKLTSGSGTIVNQHSSGQCESVSVTQDFLKNNIVWELGTNSTGATENTINQVIGLIGSRNLFLVTPYNGHAMSSADGIAEMYRNVASQHDNVYVVDWNEAVRNDESRYITRSDGMAVHPTSEGRQLLADLIHEAVSKSSNCPGSNDFVWYNQNDDRWKNSPFGTSTVGAAGCGPSSFAMLATVLLGQSITPDETSRIAGDAGMFIPGVGSDHRLTSVLAEHYGLEYKALSASSATEAIEVINQSLRSGWMIHTSGAGRRPFTNGGHYIGIRGITDDGKWLIADSYHDESDSTTKTWDPIDIVSAGIRLNNIKAIRSTSSLPTCDYSVCSDSSGSGSNGATGTEGFSSKEEARFVISEYNNTSISTLRSYGLRTPATGDPHHNCVALSTWFVNHYTSLEIKWPPNGNKLVQYLYNNYKNQYPNMTISDQPSVYSIASWGPDDHIGLGNHTGIVVGLDQERGKILVAEAGWNRRNYTNIYEYDLSRASGQYINLNDFLNSNTGLK